MLIINSHILSPINVLDLLKKILLKRLFTANAQYIMGNQRTVSQGFACLNLISRVHVQMLIMRHMMIHFHFRLGSNGNGHLSASLVASKFNFTRNLRHGGRLLRLPGLEDFRDTRKTSGDVLSSRDRSGLLSQQLAKFNLLPFNHLNSGLGREIMKIQNSAFGIFDHDPGVFFTLMLDDDAALDLTWFVFGPYGFTFFNILEFNNTLSFRKNRNTMRIPFKQSSGGFNF